MKQITSLQNTKVKNAIRLQTSRGRKQQGRFIAFGAREASRLIENNLKVSEVFITPEFAQREDWIRLLDEFKLHDNSFSVTLEVMAKLQYGDRKEGVVVVAETPGKKLARLELQKQNLIVIVESIEKPGNLGAILRTCDGAGVDAVIHANPMTDFYHHNCIRTSMGAVFGMQVVEASSHEVQQFLSSHEFQMFATIVDAKTQFNEPKYDAKNCALVFGNEANGLSEIWSRCTERLTPIGLPMRGTGDSLNVSVTVGIVVYHAALCRN